MAITTVNPRYEGFIFDGENSRDYGIYVQDVKVFGAPTRDVEMISIPGRDGEFALDKGRFNNIQVVYTCALGTDTQTDFNTGVSDFRNWLASRKGYKRLEDEINTTEYRMAVFKDGLDVSTLNKETGTFEVTFDCKPQRFLKNGEIPRTIGGAVTNTQTKSGTVVSIDSDGGDKATSLIATIEAVQAGSGDPSPDNVRAITGWTEAKVFDTGKNLVDESTATGFNAAVTVDGGYIVGGGYISVTKNGASNYPAAHIDVYLRSGVTYTVSATCVQATPQAKLAIRDVAPSNTTVATMTGYFTDGQRKSVTYAPTKSGMYRVALFSCYGTADTGTAIFTDIQLELGATATAYEPYTGTTKTTVLGRTVYGGTVDIVTGVLTVDRVCKTVNDFNWTYNSANKLFWASIPEMLRPCTLISSHYVQTTVSSLANIPNYCMWNKSYGFSDKNLVIKDTRFTDASSFKTNMSGVAIVYELATPQTYQLTAQHVELLAGQNNVWADTGDISITYGRDPNKLVNPTLFESRPLLQVWGYGGININGEDINLANVYVGKTLIGNGSNSPSYNPGYSVANAGDTVTVETAKYTINVAFSSGLTPSGDPYPSTLDTITWSHGTGTALWNVLGRYIEINATPDTCLYQTAGTIYSVTIRGTFKARDTNSVLKTGVYDFTVTGAVDAAGTFTCSHTMTKVSGDTVFANSSRTTKWGYVYVDSTKSALGTPTYIDLDIGESYYYSGSDIISANTSLTLPAKLPTLKPGHNAITFDNTVNKLVITPRWWKV